MLKALSKYLYIVILLSICALYLIHFTTVPRIRYDEGWESMVAWNYAVQNKVIVPQVTDAYHYDQMYFSHPPLYSMLLGLVYRYFGFGIFQGRAFSFLLVLLSMVLIFIRLHSLGYFDKNWMKIYALAVLISPGVFIFSRSMRPEILLLFFNSICFYSFAHVNRPRFFHVVLAGIVSALAFLTHYNSGIIIAIYLSVYLLLSKVSFCRKAIYYALFFLVNLLTAGPFILSIFKNYTVFAQQTFVLHAANASLISNFFSVEMYKHPTVIIGSILLMAVALYKIKELKSIVFSSKYKYLNIMFISSMAFFTIYFRKSNYYLLSIWPFFIMMLFVLISRCNNIMRNFLLVLYSSSLIIILGVFVTYYDYTYKDYFKLLNRYIPPQTNIVVNFEDIFNFVGRNNFILIDGYDYYAKYYHRSWKDFLKEYNIQYLILGEQNYQIMAGTDYQILYQGYIKHYVNKNVKGGKIYIIKIK